MYARATTIRVGADMGEQAEARYRETLSTFRSIEGNRGAFLLVDRASGTGVGVTLWESEQAMADSRAQADELRRRAAEEARGEIESVDEYEVVVWDVS
jgi:heme-degrading monooxygenase HmoA